MAFHAAQDVASAVAGMHFTDKVQFSKHAKSAVNRYQADIRVRWVQCGINIVRRETLARANNCFENCPSLRSELIAVFPHEVDNSP